MEHLIAKEGYSYVNEGIITKDVYCPSKEVASLWKLITDAEANEIRITLTLSSEIQKMSEKKSEIEQNNIFIQSSDIDEIM